MSEVLVAMSGGVDSSVTAALLKDQGHNVVGVTLKLWGGDSDSGCCSVSDVDDARRVAQQLGIDHHVFNFGEDFDRHVVEPYVAAYDQGETPNPCIECNRHIKFDKLLRRADVLGFDMLATGHHARVVEHPDKTFRIARGEDMAKDQSYVLHMLDQAQLRRLMLPVGNFTKGQVRELATELGLRTAAKPDSQDVCFIHSVGGRKQFLGDRIPLNPAAIVDGTGRQVGSTEAVQLVTIGQRKGLGLGGNDQRRFVTDIDRANNVITVGSHVDTLTETLEIKGLRWVSQPVADQLHVQTSAHGPANPASLSGTTVQWHQPSRRIAPGQSVVFYLGDEVAGGATAA